MKRKRSFPRLSKEILLAAAGGERPTVYLSDYCADLNKVPKLEQVEQALAAVAVETPEQLKRAKDMRTWANIIGGKV